MLQAYVDVLAGPLIFVLTYLLIVFHPKKWNEAHAAVLGAVLMAVFLLEPHHILEALGVPTLSDPIPLVSTWNVVLILATLMVVSTFLDDYGFFEFCAIRAMRMARGDARRLFLYTFAVTSLVTAFTSNDIVVLTVTPIVLFFTRRAGLDPKPFLLSVFFAANISSMFLYIGNLTNILIGDAFGLNYWKFTAIMFLPTIAAMTTTYLILRRIFRDEIPLHYPIQHDLNAWDFIKDKSKVRVGVAVLFLVILGSGVANYLHAPISIVTLAGAVFLIAYEMRPGHRLRRVSWRVVVFVVGLFVVVRGLVVVGLTDQMAGALAYSVDDSPLLAVMGLAMFSAILCNVVNNIPMTAMMLPVAAGAASTPLMREAMAYSLVIGSNLGANITIIGALAGMLWLDCCKRGGWTPSVKEFFKVGLITTPAAILASASMLAVELLVL